MNNKKLLLALTLSLAACSTQNKSLAPQDKAYNQHLACYALDPLAKKQCLQGLQFDSERQGFKQFLKNLDLPCANITEGPEFAEEKQAYLVRCKPHKQYYMRFNYDTKEWKLIEDENEY